MPEPRQSNTVIAVVTACFLQLASALSAAEPGLVKLAVSQGSDIRVSHLNRRDGLSPGEVHDIVQDDRGFLWFNTYPAQVFMGDVGALSLGAALGIIAVIVRQELILLLMGGIFVLETVSVILQVGSFKLTGKRIFKMAPIHHHFELKGWPEPRVIVRFWIITFVLVLCGLATLKLR